MSVDTLNQDVKSKIDDLNNTKIIVNAVMDKKRYTTKKYHPKISDCNQIRNKNTR